MQRREFLKYGSAGLVTLAWGTAGCPSLLSTGLGRAYAAQISLALSIQAVTTEMVDGEEVFMLAFVTAPVGPRIPGPVIRVTEGDAITLTVANGHTDFHAFDIPGITGSATGSIPPGESRTVSFIAPAGGTYLYLDPTNAPVNRVLGLHGAFVVTPANGKTPAGNPTPYSFNSLSDPRTRTVVAALFDALGTAPRFPGNRWDPADPERERVWLFNQVDPRFNALAERNSPIDAAAMRRTFLPRYFTINGLSGFFAGEDEHIVPKGYIGDPTLIRVLNAGLVTHSPHIHGNHVFELAGVGANGAIAVRSNILERDTWTMAPLDRKDVLLPFERPFDIPARAFPPQQEPFPMRYVMHCHTEMSQTAAGGNYPQGLVTHWELLGTSRRTASVAR